MLTDFNGVEFKIGDIFCYPVRRGSSLWMNKAKVTGFTHVWKPGRFSSSGAVRATKLSTNYWNDSNPNYPAKVTIQNLHNCIIERCPETASEPIYYGHTDPNTSAKFIEPDSEPSIADKLKKYLPDFFKKEPVTVQ